MCCWGLGPGTSASVSRVRRRGGFYLDTPLLTLAKFGLVGAIAIAIYLMAVARVVTRSRRLVGYATVYTTARASGFLFLALLPLGQFLEDKGLAFGLGLRLVLVVTHHGQRTRDKGDTPRDSGTRGCVREDGTRLQLIAVAAATANGQTLFSIHPSFVTG